MLHATHIISDGNDNTLSQTDYPPLPVPHLMGRMALHQFDYALMPATPQDLMGRHTPAGWPEAVAGALLHRGDRYIDGTVTPWHFHAGAAGGERRLFIANLGQGSRAASADHQYSVTRKRRDRHHPCRGYHYGNH